MTMWFVKNPEFFDVVVAPNMFGDIITDLGAMIQGGLGLAPGGNINPEGTSMFEPMGGSAPKYKGLNKVNPIATIWAGAMHDGLPGRKRCRQRDHQRHRGQPEGKKDPDLRSRRVFEDVRGRLRRRAHHQEAGAHLSPISLLDAFSKQHVFNVRLR